MSIDDLKKRIALRRKGIKPKSLITLKELFGESPDGKISSIIQKAIERELPSIIKGVVDEIANRLLTGKDFADFLTEIVKTNVSDGDEGKPGKDGDNIKGDPGKSIKGDPGKDGTTPTKAEIKKLIPKVENGKTPIKGIDYFTPLEIQMIVDDIMRKIPENETVEDIVTGINALEITPSKQIDVSHIKGIDDKRKGTKLGGIMRGGLKLIWNTELDGTINGSNTVFTIPATLPSPVDDKFLVSVRGVAKDVDNGDFTVTNSNRTVTFTRPPPTNSSRPRISMYQAH